MDTVRLVVVARCVGLAMAALVASAASSVVQANALPGDLVDEPVIAHRSRHVSPDGDPDVRHDVRHEGHRDVPRDLVPSHRAPLRTLAPPDFRVGVAVPTDQSDMPADYRRALVREFDSITPENAQKWAHLHPTREGYDFAAADRLVDAARDRGQAVRGHTLVWHRQNPAWLTNATFTSAQVRTILRDHVRTVVGHFAGRVDEWDVVNEVLDDDGDLRDTIWLRHLGPGYIADVFRWAHRADPDAALFLNDYGVEGRSPKARAYHRLARDLLEAGVPLDGVGMQSHLSVEDGFPVDVAGTMARFGKLGLDVAVTELDVRLPLSGSDPSDQQLAVQAEFYARMVRTCLEAPSCRSVTLWGLADHQSWVPGAFPGRGSPLLWDGEFRPKPAHAALQRLLRPRLSVADGAAREGDGEVRVPLTIDRPMRHDVHASVRLLDDSARGGSDFVASVAQATIPAGATSTEVVVHLHDDRRRESRESLVVQVAASDAVVADGLGRATIIDDDITPLPPVRPHGPEPVTPGWEGGRWVSLPP